MTETGSVMGTAQYLSPEQAQGQPVDARSDLYSIGIVLYEMLTGRVPFDAESPVTVALKQVSEAPGAAARARPGRSRRRSRRVVLRALEKDPAQRFADADEFIAALQAARAAPEGAGRAAAAPMEEILEEEDRGAPLVAVAADPAGAGGDRVRPLPRCSSPSR